MYSVVCVSLLRESPSHTDIAMVCNLTRSSACVFLLITVISPSLISRLGHNNLTAKCTEDLASALSKNCSLTELHLHNNKLADSGVKRLLVALRDSDKIQQPWLQSNNLSDDCTDDLISFLSTNSSLKILSQESNSFTDQSVQALCEVIETRTKPERDSPEGESV
eukprot:gi/632980385/ref/XP_007907005.1/ PREDICTED: NACHT, LRR and PYD domains-containing protein 1-like isoform X2 [Callorhinchus milii]